MQSRIALCSVCHSQMSASQSYCKNCGSTLCPHCRELLPQRSRFCPKCGFLCVVEQPNPINKQASSAPTMPSAMPPAMPIPRAVSGGQHAARAAVHQQPAVNTAAQYHRNCPKCGASIDHELGRCSSCGLLYGGTARAMQQPATAAMPIPRATVPRPQSSAGRQSTAAYNTAPQYSTPRNTPPPSGTGQRPNYASMSVTPQGSMLMPIPSVARTTAGTMAPPGAPVPQMPYHYQAAPSAPMERRAPATGREGLSGFATTIIIVMVCLLIGGGIYYFINRTETTPEIDNVVNTSVLSMSNVTPQSITETSATITWNTDKPASGQVNFGKTEEYDSMAQDVNFSTSHSVALTDLDPNTPYYFEAISIDANGNKKTRAGELKTLRTATAAADTIPPTISGAAANATESTAIVTWITDEPTTSQVKYSNGQNTSTTPEDTNLTVSHSVTLSNLDSGTTYTFTIISKDAAGNPATSASNQTFTTVSSVPVAAKEGSLAPDFTLKNLNGNNVNLSDFRGEIVMVNFWATWCVPCMEELPFLQTVSDNASANGLKVLTVNDKESKNQVLSFINSEGYTFTVLLDSSGEVNTLYNVKYYPTTFFINADGIIKKIVEGSFQDQATIENILKTIQ